MIGPGDVLGGRYALVRQLGEGAMGCVYEARHMATGRRLALKVIHRRLAADEALVRRFQAEARAAGRIESEHVAQVVDVDTDAAAGVPYLVMEYLVGEDIDALLRRLGPLPPALAARIAAQACFGLERAHAAGIVHRDVKPANLFLAEKDTGERVVKVVDFGVAKLGGDEAPGSALTRTGGLVGSPLYMSPEQARGVRDIDARTDVWSLGVVLYQMLAGEAPHARVDLVGDLLIAICTRPPRPVTELSPWVEPALAQALDKALAVDRDLRYGGARAFREALLALLPEGTGIRAADVRGIGAGRAAAADGGAFARTEAVSGAQATSDFLAERGLGVNQDTARAHAADEPGAPAEEQPPAVENAARAHMSPGATATGATAASSAAQEAPSAPAPARAKGGGALGAVVAIGALLAAAAAALIAWGPGEGRSGLAAPASGTGSRGEAGATAGATASDSAGARGDASGSSGAGAPGAGAGQPDPPLTFVCADPTRSVGAGPRCAAPARAWCDAEDRVVACCGVGLVPAGDEGLCTCAPGGTEDRDALRSGCPKDNPAEQRPEAMQRLIRSSFGQFRRCYETALTRSPEARGTVSVTFEVGPDGRAGKAFIQHTSLPDVGAQRCLLGAFRELRLAPPKDGHQRVTYPIVFEPGE